MPEQESETARTERLLIETAKSTTTDLYALLSLPSPLTTTAAGTPADPPTASVLKKAWRQAALKHHPDKNPGKEAESGTKLDEIKKALDILSHPVARSAYDERLRARAEKQAREAAFEGKRRRMKEELEARENFGRSVGAGTPNTSQRNGSGASAGSTGSPQAGQKRKFGSGTAFGVGSGGMHATSNGDDDPELRRLAAEGARRRQEREERVKKEREEAARMEAESGGEQTPGSMAAPSTSASTPSKKFTFSTPDGKKTGIGTGSRGAAGTPGSASTRSLYQSTMQRLRDAEQKRKSGLQQPIVQQDMSETTSAG